MRVPILASAAALLIATGCIHVSTLRTGPVLAPKPPGTPIRVFDLPPQQPYTELARLEARVSAGMSENLVIENFQESARELGADAIIVGGERLVGISGMAMNGMVSTNVIVDRSATAIVFRPVGGVVGGIVSSAPAPYDL